MSIRRGDFVCIRHGSGALVTVDRGTAWLTQDGDRRDIVLEAGGSFRLDRGGVAVVSGFTTAELTVTAAAGASLPAIERSPRVARAATLPGRLVYDF
jgi:hypothetical protein